MGTAFALSTEIEIKAAPQTGLPRHHQVILSAAVAAVAGRESRIRQIREVPRGPSPWTVRGRLAIQYSHELMPVVRVLQKGGRR